MRVPPYVESTKPMTLDCTCHVAAPADCPEHGGSWLAQCLRAEERRRASSRGKSAAKVELRALGERWDDDGI